MAERGVVTKVLFQNVSRFLSGGTDANAGVPFSHMALCGEAMGGFSVDTVNFTEVGERQAVTPTRVTKVKTDDAVKMEKDAWEPGADTVHGTGIFTSATTSDNNLQAFHEWAAAIDFEAGDKVKATIEMQSLAGT